MVLSPSSSIKFAVVRGAFRRPLFSLLPSIQLPGAIYFRPNTNLMGPT